MGEGDHIEVRDSRIDGPTVFKGTQYVTYTTQAVTSPLEPIAEWLKIQVQKQWRAEAEVRRLDDPHQLPVSWKPVAQNLVEEWQFLTKTASDRPGISAAHCSGWAVGPHELADSDGAITDVLRKVPTGRLVLLGDPGTGKSMLLIRLVLGLLARRSPGEPVPVLVSLASWDPDRQDLRAWLADRLALDHPDLCKPGPSEAGQGSRVAMLLDGGLLLPVLDGLDELPEAVRASAISKINDALDPGEGLVLTCRTAEYKRAVRYKGGRSVRLRGAAGIVLQHVSPQDVREYLRRGASGKENEDRWSQVFQALGTKAPVSKVLRTPLAVNLAHIIYNPSAENSPKSRPHPSELCDSRRFPTPVTVSRHLFDAFIAAAYRPHPRHPLRWKRQRAEIALTYLAKHLEEQLDGSTDIAWWRLHIGLSFWKLSHFGALCGLVLGLAIALPIALLSSLSIKVMIGITLPAIAFGFLWGGLAGMHSTVGRSMTPGVGIRWTRKSIKAGILGPDQGGGCGLLLGFVVGVQFDFWTGVTTGLMYGLFAFSLSGIELRPANLKKQQSQGNLLMRQYVIGWKSAITVGLALAFSVGLASFFTPKAPVPMPFRSEGGTLMGVFLNSAAVGSVGAALGLVVWLVISPWGPFLIVRLFLSTYRSMPLKIIGFLTDAHEKRGVLRRVGAVYQFRHVELQRYLAARG
ncbi:NACHT domain-containing protein [Streptomyces sp. NPDC001275]